MKSFIGLAVAQVPAFLAADLPFAVHLAFSYDEEVGGFGARRLIADMRDAGRRAARLHRRRADRHDPGARPQGRLPLALLRARPRRAFVADAAVGQRDRGRRARRRASSPTWPTRWRDEEPRYEGFDVPYSTGSVGVIEGGIADNVVPADCRFHYEFRNLPGSDVTAMQGEVRAYAETLEPAMRAVDADAGIRFETICEMPAFLAGADDPAVLLAQRLAATDATTLVAFGTEAGLFQRAGMPTVVCGPGHIAQAHQADEYVSLAQLAAGERFLLALTTGGIFPVGGRA